MFAYMYSKSTLVLHSNYLSNSSYEQNVQNVICIIEGHVCLEHFFCVVSIYV